MRKESTLETKRELSPNLSTHERKWIKSFLPSHGKRMGFRTFTKSEPFLAVLAKRMEEIEDQHREDCERDGVEYIALDPFSTKEKIKVEEWKKLTDEDKEKWRERGRVTIGLESITE